MPEFKELLEKFNYKADTSKAIFDLFSRVISLQATLSSLKDLVFENLTNCTGKSEEQLLKEFEEFFAEHRKELLTDFISKYGKLKDIEGSSK